MEINKNHAGLIGKIELEGTSPQCSCGLCGYCDCDCSSCGSSSCTAFCD